MTAPSSHSPLAFGDFLAHLQQQGFTVGVDHHLRLQELLRKVSHEHCAPQDLKTLLCPLFATNDKEQLVFYHAFDAYFAIFRPTFVEEDAQPLPAKSAQQRGAPLAVTVLSGRRAVLTALAGALLLGGLVFSLLHTSWFEKFAVAPQLESTPTAQPSGTSPEPTRELSPQEAPQTTTVPGWLWDALRIGMVLLPLLGFVVYEGLRRRRAQLVLERARGRKPPTSWPFRVDVLGLREYSSEQFFKIVRGLRRRQIGEFRRLDVAGTIAATVAAAGHPRLHYRLDTRTPEYLILIDRVSVRDHQAGLFDSLTQALKKEDLFVARYFYDNDPRVCWTDAPQGAVFLTDLQRQYPSHRLLLFGDGDALLDPLSGQLTSWAAVFLEWQDRAVLTPVFRTAWRQRERTLARSFAVFPATLDGLEELADYFELPVATDGGPQRRQDAEPPPPDPDEPIPVHALRAYLGEAAFQWLCACAVYPELQWELTLYLGSLPCMSRDLVQEEPLLKLVRLPWFRTGSLPDELRLQLIHELAAKREHDVRAALIGLLERNPAPPGTLAAAARQLDLVSQQVWSRRHEPRAFRRAVRDLDALPPGELARDYALVRLLQSTAVSPLALRLPRRLWGFFYERSTPAFGFKASVRALATLIVILSGLLGLEMMRAATEPPSSALVAQAPPASPPSPSNTQPEPTPEGSPPPVAQTQTQVTQPPETTANEPIPPAPNAPPQEERYTSNLSQEENTAPAPQVQPPASPSPQRPTEAPPRKERTSKTDVAGNVPNAPSPSQTARQQQQVNVANAPPSALETYPAQSKEEPSPREPVETAKTSPLPETQPPPFTTSISNDDVQGWLERWRRAWEEKDVARIMQSGTVANTDAEGLKELLSEYKRFDVALQDVSIKPEGNRAAVQFARIDTIDGRTMRPIWWSLTLEKKENGSIAVLAARSSPERP